NRVELVELLFACSRLGAMLVVVNNRLTAHEIAVQLDDCRPTVVLADTAFADTIREATAGDFGDLDRFVETAYSATEPDGETIGGSGAPDAGVLLVYTSGTTGRPKGAVLTNRSLLYTARNGIEHEGFDQASVTVSVLPMFHVGGLNVQLLPTLLAGGTVILEERFDPARLVDLLVLHRPSHLLLVPAAMQAVLDRAAAADLGIGEVMGSLGALNCGSSIVPVELIDRFASNGVPVVQVYGATETGPTAIVLAYENADRVGSCGTPAAHTELRILLPSGDDAEPGQVGELLVRGPNLFVRYWENPEATESAFLDGWYRTGDLGYVDRDGFTYVTGRTKELIISGGENIYPAEVEQCIERHPGVVAAAVLGTPDPRWGETPVAVVVAADDGGATEADLTSWTRTHLAGYKQPTRWVFVDSMPRTSLGKVQKHHLRELLDSHRG
ncbi:MAG: AMP-binding protein, partial [Actinomycetota bacterium]